MSDTQRSNVLLQIRGMQRVCVDTGNVHRHTELFKQIFKNSAEELIASVTFQLEKPGGPFVELKPDGTVLLTGSEEECRKQKDDLESMREDDMRITLKIFMSSLDYKQVEEAVEVAACQLNVKSISQLIIAFPSIDELKWLTHVLPLWRQLETLVATKRKVYTLGVADLDVLQLKALYEAANEVRPMIDHYNTESCCTVPQELRDYAKEKDIQLLTHNDPNLCTVCDRLKLAMEVLLGKKNKFELQWTARYTVWLRSRSVIGAKGYILQFEKSAESE